MTELPPRPPRHSSSQPFFSGGSSGGGPASVSRGPLPPVPQAQSTQPTVQPRPPPARSRPQSTSGLVYNRNDSGQLTQFGPGKQEKEVRTLYNVPTYFIKVINGPIIRR